MNIRNLISTLCLVLSSVLIISSCHRKENSTIYNPVVEKNETNGILEISMIEFTDTATVFYFDAYANTSNISDSWFRISQEVILQGSNQAYKITSCDSIELGEKIQFSESGHISFVLYFEPVDKLEKTVEFQNYDFRISGIKLHKQPATAIKCTLKGEVINRPQSCRLILLKEGENSRFNQWKSIPVRNGKFEYVLNCDDEELYQLIFYDEDRRGSWRPVNFISEQGVVHFTLHPSDQFEMNHVEGGVLNREYQNFENEEKDRIVPIYAIFEQLRNDGNYYTPEAQLLLDQIDASTDQEEKRVLISQYMRMQDEKLHITSAIKEVEDSLNRIFVSGRLQFSREHPNIAGYSILITTAQRVVRDFGFDILPLMDVYNTVYAPKYPDHPYTAKMINLLTGSSLKAGTPFIDFTAVDMTGKSVTLSDRITGKPTVLHLWASWCGPCRQKGKELIPVYEEFRDKGFVVIGVARERGSSTAAEAAIKLDKYPWENLVEINDIGQIWAKYGIGNAAGGEFLIDETGTIVAVAPSIEEIKNFLKEKLQ